MSEPKLRLYNTLTRTKEDFVPLDPANVRMYVCGPTVYDYAHIGNARPVIVFDVLYRLLRHHYGEAHVTYARNITDVDDKINARALRDHPGLPLNDAIAKVTQPVEDKYMADARALGCLDPSTQPRATAHLSEMRAIIERLVQRGAAYVAENHVLFSVSAMQGQGNLPKYGSLARRSLDEMLAGARVEVAPYKRDPMDFVLWKPSDEGMPGWPSPCGIAPLGRPGWHIECSAMSMATLLAPFGGGLDCDDPDKNTFDIHGGGVDLVFPHHENEIAQSCCAFGSQRMANIWMHNGFLQVEGEKMSKSLGNFITIDDLLNTTKFGGRKWPGEVLRLAMLKTHYLQPIDWTARALDEAITNLDRWSRHVRLLQPLPAEVKLDNRFLSRLADDLNTPLAIAALNEMSADASGSALISGPPTGEQGKTQEQRRQAAGKLLAAMQFLGIWKETRPSSEVDTSHIEALITARLAARTSKNFAESDRIRDELVAMGIEIQDAKDFVTGELSTTWRVKP